MKSLKRLVLSGALLASLFTTATASAGTHYLWNGPGDMNWSTGGNWLPVGVPGPSDNVTFTNLADAGAPYTPINNIVDAGFTTSINSLGYQHTNTFHNTQIINNLSVMGTSATDVAVIDDEGQPHVFFVGNNEWQDVGLDVYTTISGNSLLVSNVNANFGVTEISTSGTAHRATLDLTNVNTFTCVVSNFFVGHNFTQPDHAWRPTGELFLAKTNSITTRLIVVSDAYQNSGGDCYIHLGPVNTINSDEVRVAMHKCNGHIDMTPGLVNPTVKFRDATGTGRQLDWEVGDENDPNGNTYLFGFFTSNQAQGYMDLTGAKVDALVDQIILGRGQIQFDSTFRNGDGNGVLIFGGGTIDVNNIQMGIQVPGPFIGGSIGRGALIVNNDDGVNPALLNVHTNITMAVIQPGSSDAPGGSFNALFGDSSLLGSQASITVNGGSTIAVAGDIISGGGYTTINLNSGGKLDMKPAGDTTAGNVSVGSLNIVDGILANYDTLSDITNINVSSSGTPVFTVSPGQTITVGSVKKIATLNVSGSLTLRGTTLMDIGKSGGTPLYDQITATSTVDLGGTLKVTFTGAHDDLAAGDKFILFAAAPTYTAPTVILPPPGSGLKWQNNINVDGSVQVVACGCGEPTTPPTLTITPTSPTAATVSWPVSYTTFALRSQTNAPGASISTTWGGFVPGVVGNSVSVPLNPANGSVYYDLIQQ